jgi:hypothetical protein
MPLEHGGRADKQGNRYEIRWCIYQLLRVFEEKSEYVLIEPIGEDEEGIDLWIGNLDGTREGQQCKGRYGPNESWDFGALNAKNILKKWKSHLNRSTTDSVSLVSPLSFTNLEDLSSRARNSGDPFEFYSSQILGSDSKFIKFVTNTCLSLGYDITDKKNASKMINDLSRINYRQSPDGERKEIIFDKIGQLFHGEETAVYDVFVSWVIDSDIWGKRIDSSRIHSFLDGKNISQRNLASDSRVFPRIRQLNQAYKDDFIPFSGGLFDREERKKCLYLIDKEDSILLHGAAGTGKSGITELIIEKLESEKTPYIALKLDKTEPRKSLGIWSSDLELPGSIVHCIDKISQNTKAVIILDQLDSLRWTSPHSREALSVCSELIRQVENVNIERKNKISVVFVCRTYDYINDNNINAFFKKNKGLVWNEVEVSILSETLLNELIGDMYNRLTEKIKSMLRYPSNLFIWQHLDSNAEKFECNSTFGLVDKWWRQIVINAWETGIDDKLLETFRLSIMSVFEKEGRLNALSTEINMPDSVIDYLVSSGILVEQKTGHFRIISFVHQSIYDCFQSERMFLDYYSGKDIITIIGAKIQQTPTRRYQFQMFLQNLLEYSENQFIELGKEILAHSAIRFAYKFVFFELLAQISEPSNHVSSYISEAVENEQIRKHIIASVIQSNKAYIYMLFEKGYFERWLIDGKKDDIFLLLQSNRDSYTDPEIDFIRAHILDDDKDISKWLSCFPFDIHQDSDALFELRMIIYKTHPEYMDLFFDFKSLFLNFEMRAVDLLILMLEVKSSKGNRLHTFEGLIEYNSEFMLTNCEIVSQRLLELIPTGNDYTIEYSDWCDRTEHNNSVERAIMLVTIKASISLAENYPDRFLAIYSLYLGAGSTLHNELILNGLAHLPLKYSDMVIEYLIADIDTNIICKSMNDLLKLGKEAIKQHITNCSYSVKERFFSSIIKYKPENVADIYKRRIEYNRQENVEPIYFSFWGDLQYDIFSVIPEEYLTREAFELLRVLQRRYGSSQSMYVRYLSHGGFVKTPIDGKNLSTKTWSRILTSKKLVNCHRHHNSREVEGGFIEVSLEDFASTFTNVVKDRPQEMSELILSMSEVNEAFVESLFSGLAMCDELNSLSTQTFECLISKYPVSMEKNNYRAKSICRIFSAMNSNSFSKQVLNLIKKIAIYHEDPVLEGKDNTRELNGVNKTRNEIHTVAINCSRGVAARTIGNLLWDNASLFAEVDEVIQRLCTDPHPAVRFSSMYALWPAFNISQDWTKSQLIRLYEDNSENILFPKSKEMLFRLYDNYRDNVINVIRSCLCSEIEEVSKLGAYTLVEMYIQKGEFCNDFKDVSRFTKKQADSIMYMLTLYFDIEQHKEKAKEILLKFNKAGFDLEWSVSQMLRDKKVTIAEDEDFLSNVLSTGFSRRYMYAFNNFLSNAPEPITVFSDLIFKVAESVIKGSDIKRNIYFDEDDIVKLIIGLYDSVSYQSDDISAKISEKCLDVWDSMFEHQVGSSRRLSFEMMQR